MSDHTKAIKATPEDVIEFVDRRHQKPILWVGAGLSVGAGVPSTDAILDRLKASCRKLDLNQEFTGVVDAFVTSCGKPALQNILHELFSVPYGPTAVHRALARLARADVFEAIITTNYDRLLEDCLRDEFVHPVLQTLEDNAQVSGKLRLIKLHGSVESWRQTILSGKSYEDFEERYGFLKKQLDVLLGQHPVLFLGCSMKDPRLLEWLAQDRGHLDLQAWRPMMTEGEWEDAAKQEALDEQEIRPLTVQTHQALIPLWTEVADRLAPVCHSRLDCRITVLGREDWTVNWEGMESLERKNPLANDEFEKALEQLRTYDHKPVPTDEHGAPTREAHGGLVTPLLRLAAHIGDELTTAVFSDAALQRVQAAINARLDGDPPHLHIIVEAASPGNEDAANEVLALPWELIRLGGDFPVSRATLDVSREAFVSNLTGLDEPTVELKVVAAVSAPYDATELNYEEESYRLYRALGDKSRIEVTDLGTVEELLREVKAHEPPIVHFTGHGAPGALFFETETGTTHRVEVEKLVGRLRAEANFPRLMYLACCYGATASKSTSTAEPGTRVDSEERAPKMVDPALLKRPSPATAATLHRAGIHQVLGYFGPVGDRQATQVSEAFYEGLAEGKNALAAVRQARIQAKEALKDVGKPTHCYPLGWAQLAFYQRGAMTQTTLPPQGDRNITGDLHERETESLATGVDRLHIGFVGRRRDRSTLLSRWKKDGERCFVVCGLGGLGKTALCTELAPLFAERVFEGKSIPILALSGKDAKKLAGRDRDVLFQLWEQVAKSRESAEWGATVAALQENGINGGSLLALMQAFGEEDGVLVYLDDAESLQKSVANVARAKRLELGQWVHSDLRAWWENLCNAATRNGSLAVVASSRYLPEGTPEKALHSLSPLSTFEVVKMMSWFLTLGRLPSADAEKLAERIDGHPRTVEYLEGLVGLQEARRSAPGGRYAGGEWWNDIVEPVLVELPKRLEADILLPKLWKALPESVQEQLGRCSCLLEPAPLEAISSLEDETDPETTRRLIHLGLLGPGGLQSDQLWAPHRLVVEEVEKHWDGDREGTCSRLRQWFADRWQSAEQGSDLFSAANYAIASKNGADSWELVARICNGLRSAGRYREALEWAECVSELELSKVTRLELDHERGFLFDLMGNYSAARRTRERVLRERREDLGDEHPDTLTSMHNLAHTLWAQGDHSGARELQEQVLAIMKRVLGDEHPDTLSSMNNLASTLWAQGDHSGARELQEQVLAIMKRVMGDEHPSTLSSMNNLALTLKAQGDHSGARELQEQVLAARKRVLGDEHPDTLMSMSNLASTLWAQGDHSGARELEEQVLAARKRVLGDEHPSTLSSMNNLASTLWAQGDHSGARELQEQVLAARKRVLGDEHPDTLMSMSNLASTLWAQGDHSGARELQEQVLAARKRVLGDEHPSTLMSMHNLASTLKAQGDHSGARELQEQVLAARKRVLGDEHPDTLMSMSNLASTLWAQGDHSGARELFASCVRGMAKSLGMEHPDFQAAVGAYLSLLKELHPDEGEKELVARMISELKR